MNKILEGAKAISEQPMNFYLKNCGRLHFIVRVKLLATSKGFTETTLIKTNKKFVMLALLLMIQELKLIIQI